MASQGIVVGTGALLTPGGARGPGGSSGTVGPPGPAGPPGGASANTTLTAAFAMPAVNATAIASVANAAAFSVGGIAYINPIGYLSVQAVNAAANQLTLQNLGYAGNQAPGSTAPIGNSLTGVGPPGPQGPAGSTGNTGPTGSAATATSGTTQTGAPGTAANVSNVGSTSAAVFNFVVPRGSQWFQGNGPPPATIAGALPGDFYLDNVSADVYVVT